VPLVAESIAGTVAEHVRPHPAETGALAGLPNDVAGPAHSSTNDMLELVDHVVKYLGSTKSPLPRERGLRWPKSVGR
jgi:hypothetical protein